MNADEAFRPVGLGAESGDRDRRGVGRHHRLGIEQRAELGEDLALHRLVLGRRFDHQIRAGQALHGAGAGNARQRFLAQEVVDLAGGYLPRHVAADRGDALFHPVGGDIVDQHLVAGEGRDVSDAAPHLSRADDADRFDPAAHRK